MSILYNKVAVVYKYERNSNMVASYTALESLRCNIQPVWVRDWFDWAIMFEMKKLYTDYGGLSVWDKLSIDWITYIVKTFDTRQWKMREYYKAFIQKSEWQ